MNDKVKKKWLKALTSGRYKQGRGQLCKKSKGEIRHCCLGVLCDLYAKEHKLKHSWVKVPGQPAYSFHPTGERSSCWHLPEYVERWADLPDCDPRVNDPATGEFTGSTLTLLNDTKRFSFKKIAKIIKELL